MSNDPQPQAPDAIHFLVFRDHLASKSFAISSRWIDSLGWGVGLLTLITVASVLFAARSYRLTRDVDPTRLRDLEGQLVALQVALEASKHAAAPAAPAPLETAVAVVITAPAVVPAIVAPAQPVVVTETPVAPVAVASPAATPVFLSPLAPVVTAPSLIDFSQVPTRPTSELAFALKSKSVKWRGNDVSVRFKIEYTKGDRGHQQGRIVLVAQGPKQTQGYPRTLFEKDKPPQVIASRGEFFSVSRSRPVRADFGPFSSHSSIEYVDVLIFDLSDQLLFFERLKPTLAAAPARRTAPPPARAEPTPVAPEASAPAADAPATTPETPAEAPPQ